MQTEGGLGVDRTTVFRWVQTYTLELEKRINRQLKPTNDVWWCDETDVTVQER